jgi:DNA-binding NtrC family response regulator
MITMPGSDLLNGKRILIVDDESDVLDLLEEFLSASETFRAASYDEAKALLESQDFDIAVLDIMGVDGYRLLAMANKKQIPAVMLTAHALTPEHLTRSIKEGAVSYIPKEEMGRIAEFLEEILKAKKEGRDPLESWQRKFPSSYFEKRWGAAWQEVDKDFWDRFRASIRAGKSRSGE